MFVQEPETQDHDRKAAWSRNLNAARDAFEMPASPRTECDPVARAPGEEPRATALHPAGGFP